MEFWPQGRKSIYAAVGRVITDNNQNWGSECKYSKTCTWENENLETHKALKSRGKWKIAWFLHIFTSNYSLFRFRVRNPPLSLSLFPTSLDLSTGWNCEKQSSCVAHKKKRKKKHGEEEGATTAAKELGSKLEHLPTTKDALIKLLKVSNSFQLPPE